MKPYYDDGQSVIHLGDCRELLPEIIAQYADFKSNALVLTDPPYGINYEPTRRGNGSKMWGAERVRGDRTPFDPGHLFNFPSLVLFGANHYAHLLPPSGGWLVWDKTPNGVREGFFYSHAELAWTNLSSLVSKYSLEWQGNLRNGEGFFHPTQKPVALMRWVIEKFAKASTIVVDPYMGSGTTLVAAKQLGRAGVGIEIEERYCEIAAKRLSQEILPMNEAV